MKQWIVSIACVVMSFVSTLHAQTPGPQIASAVELARWQESTQTKPAALATKVTVAFHDVELKTALRDVAQQADIRITLGEPVLALKRRVTLKATNERADHVLQQLIAGSGVVMAVTPSGHAVFSLGTQATRVEGIVIGKIVHAKTKQPVTNATVSTNALPAPVTVGTDGTFRISLPAGEHTLNIRAVGLQRKSQTVTVRHTETMNVEIVLDPSASVLDEVVVTGTIVATERKALTTPITIITAQELEQRGITRMEQLFRGEVPGVIALERGTATFSPLLGAMVTSRIYARGSSDLNGGTNPLKTYVDGVELTDPAALGVIDPRTIERIEIITGPQAATIYGSGALGGVMQIFTKRGQGRGIPELRWVGKYGTLENNLSRGKTPAHDYLLSATGSEGPVFSYAGSASYGYTGQWQPDLFTRQWGGSAGMTYKRGPVTVGGTVSLSYTINGTSESAGLANLWQTGTISALSGMPGYTGATSYQRINNGVSQMGTMNIDVQPVRWWQSQATLGRNQVTYTLDPVQPLFMSASDTMFAFNSSQTTRTTFSTNMTLLPPSWGPVSQVLTVGFNGGRGNTLGVTGTGATVQATSYLSPTVTTPTPDENWGGFGSLRVGAFDRLFLTFGMRGERNPRRYGENHKVDWTPTNGITYTFEVANWSLKLLGSYGSATRPPKPDQRNELRSPYNPTFDPAVYVQQLAAPELTPEYERGPQGGVEFYYGNAFSLTLNHYQQKVLSLIQTVVADSVAMCPIQLCGVVTIFRPQFQYQNVADIRKRGWEATGSLAWRAFTWGGTYSWNDSRVVSVPSTALGSAHPGMSFPGVPSHMANLRIGYAHGNTSMQWTTNSIGATIQIGTANGRADFYPRAARLLTYSERTVVPTGFVYHSRPGYSKSDLMILHRITSRLGATVNVMNVGNSYGSEERNNFYYPTLGRQTRVGVDVRFGGGR